MTKTELAELIAEHTITFTCHCGAQWIVPEDSVAVLFHVHPVAQPRRRHSYTLPEVRTTREDFLNPIYGALAANIDDIELLRRIEEEE